MPLARIALCARTEPKEAAIHLLQSRCFNFLLDSFLGAPHTVHRVPAAVRARRREGKLVLRAAQAEREARGTSPLDGDSEIFLSPVFRRQPKVLLLRHALPGTA